ncbi:unnamed protein product [Rhodiola kirilowii]
MQTRSKGKEKVNASFDQALKHFLDQERAKGQGSRNKRQPRKQRPPPMEQLPPNGEKPLKDYSTPRLAGVQSPIAPPGVNAPQFELKPTLINMVGNKAFTGIGNPNLSSSYVRPSSSTTCRRKPYTLGSSLSL